MTTKTCAACKETKPVGDFHKERSRKDGLACYCRACESYRKCGVKDVEVKCPSCHETRMMSRAMAKRNATGRCSACANASNAVLGTRAMARRADTRADAVRRSRVKTCGRCRAAMDTRHFYDDPRARDGKQAACKRCWQARRRRVDVTCGGCNAVVSKPASAVASWAGRCFSCRMREHNAKLSRPGAANPNWKGGVSNANQIERGSPKADWGVCAWAGCAPPTEVPVHGNLSPSQAAQWPVEALIPLPC